MMELTTRQIRKMAECAEAFQPTRPIQVEDRQHDGIAMTMHAGDTETVVVLVNRHGATRLERARPRGVRADAVRCAAWS